jgi:adenylyltransferase/sulfurtransferase
MLTKDELKRYNRHIIMPEFGLRGQEKLKKAKILVIGAGGLGSPVLLYLTASGVGNIGIIEYDLISETNLQRQILYSVDDIGKSKVEVAVNKLKNQNPYTNFIVYDFPFNKSNALEIIKNYDVIVDCSDNFATRFLVNDTCVILDKPFIFGAIYKFEGQVSVFNYKKGPTYRCLIPDIPKDSEVPSCSEIGVLGVIPGIIGCMQAAECIKVITEIGEVLSGKLFVIDILNFSTNIISFSKSDISITELGEYDEVCKHETIKIQEIDAIELKLKLENKEEILIIDIRSSEEFSEFNLGGINIEEELLISDINLIPIDKTIVIICKHGSKSEELIKELTSSYNFANLWNLFGGINSYIALNV